MHTLGMFGDKRLKKTENGFIRLCMKNKQLA
jgi:hypothetical protein